MCENGHEWRATIKIVFQVDIALDPGNRFAVPHVIASQCIGGVQLLADNCYRCTPRRLRSILAGYRFIQWETEAEYRQQLDERLSALVGAEAENAVAGPGHMPKEARRVVHNLAGVERSSDIKGVLISSGARNVIGGLELNSRNEISGNEAHGALIERNVAAGNVILGNYIGTDATGGIPISKKG